MFQVQSTGRYRGFVDCLQQTARTEGVQALWKGLTPALVRQAPAITQTFCRITEKVPDCERLVLRQVCYTSMHLGFICGTGVGEGQGRK